MKWIRTGRQLGQAVKNVQRLRQILSVFAKHGFADVVDRMDLGRFLPARFTPFAEKAAEQSTPERLRRAFGAGRWRKREGIARVELSDGAIRDAEVVGTKPMELFNMSTRS